MRKHTTHFDDCGCLSENKNKRIEALEWELKEIRESRPIGIDDACTITFTKEASQLLLNTRNAAFISEEEMSSWGKSIAARVERETIERCADALKCLYRRMKYRDAAKEIK